MMMERKMKKHRSPSVTSNSSASSSSESDDGRRGAIQTRFPFVPPPVYKSKVRDAILDAKKRHRTDIKCDKWDREGFAGSDVCELPLDESNPIKREHCSELSVERFIEEYETPCVPVVIDGIPEAENWTALQNWTLKRLRKDYKKVQLKCGEDDDGKSIRMKLKYFLTYMKHQTDDSPLYIFDSTFEDRADTKPLLADYKVPRYFPEDLFELVGEDRRPPYRWFLIGPKRSGTCVHVDPLGTSAWNTLIIGRKRWVLFPPEVPKKIVKGKDHIRRGEDDEAVNFFMDILPRMKAAHSPELLQCVEFMQYPGETVFIPGGWWHAVFNVEDTVAVTQNFCSTQNFARVWRKTRSGRKRMAVKWLAKLEREYPHLARLAVELNEKDQFVMYNKEKKKQNEDISDHESMRSTVSSMQKKKTKKQRASDEEGDDEGEGMVRKKKAKMSQ